MRYFPIFLDLEDQRVVVVGGGEQAAQKLRLLLKSSARIAVIAKHACDEVERLACAGRISLERRDFAPGDLDGCRLPGAATASLAEAAHVAAAARAMGIPLNVVDRPDLSSFI